MSEIKLTNFPVTGMTCANCATAVERNINKVNGVNLANVNLSSERASVKYDTSLTDIAEIVKKEDNSELHNANIYVHAIEVKSMKDKEVKDLYEKHVKGKKLPPRRVRASLSAGGAMRTTMYLKPQGRSGGHRTIGAVRRRHGGHQSPHRTTGGGSSHG